MQAIPVELTRLQSVDSTNRALYDLLKLGAPVGSAVIADGQTGGRGQLGRLWYSPHGVALYLSFSAASVDPAGIPFAAGLASALTLRRATDTPAVVRWPNDVLLNGRKTAGVLVESGPEKGVWVVGCGLNINNPAFPHPLDRISTSPRLETGRSYNLPECEVVFWEEANAALGLLESQGLDGVLARWRELDVTPGSRVRVRADDGSERLAEAQRVDEEGRLVTTDGQVVQTIISSSLIQWPEPGSE